MKFLEPKLSEKIKKIKRFASKCERFGLFLNSFHSNKLRNWQSGIHEQFSMFYLKCCIFIGLLNFLTTNQYFGLKSSYKKLWLIHVQIFRAHNVDSEHFIDATIDAHSHTNQLKIRKVFASKKIRSPHISLVHVNKMLMNCDDVRDFMSKTNKMIAVNTTIQ